MKYGVCFKFESMRRRKMMLLLFVPITLPLSKIKKKIILFSYFLNYFVKVVMLK